MVVKRNSSFMLDSPLAVTPIIRHGPRECNMRYAILCEYDMGRRRANAICNTRKCRGPRECGIYAICEYAMSRANKISDTRIRYSPREYDMRYAKTPRECGMRYASTLWPRECIRENAMGRANAICDTRIGYVL